MTKHCGRLTDGGTESNGRGGTKLASLLHCIALRNKPRSLHLDLIFKYTVSENPWYACAFVGIFRG
jgi:hypothetical protein